MPQTEVCIEDAGIKTPVRNRYFYGKLMDVYHFDLEQRYFNDKRWLLNRYVTGYGVICGLDVKLSPDEQKIIVTPGIAIDRCGREIIVPTDSREVNIPADLSAKTDLKQEQQQKHECDDVYVHVCICYHECLTDPEPAISSDCDIEQQCTPGAIREQYKIVIKKGRAPEIHSGCSIKDLMTGGQLKYEVLAHWITRACPELPDDCCIPLAEIRLPAFEEKNVDITVRPIVYTNDLLFELIQASQNQGKGHTRAGKNY